MYKKYIRHKDKKLNNKLFTSEVEKFIANIK